MERSALLLALLLAACANPAQEPRAAPAPDREALLLLNRITWGANGSSAREIAELGSERWLERQLHPPVDDGLPPDASAQIAAMVITQRSTLDLVTEIDRQRKAVRSNTDGEQRGMEKQSLQRDLTRLAREAAARSTLRALYSPWQLREQMTWFWMNHFSVFQGKADVRALVADYEERAIRPHALGRFRDLLGAVARHPAMLRYLDNARNASGRLNENYARELMELHTLGVDGGYVQADVQELARVLTGFGIVNPELDGLPRRRDYVRDGLFEFAPGRHDYGPKILLGEPIRARGYGEMDEALDRLARHPSTARFISRKLAVFFVSDDPSAGLVQRMTDAFRRSDGDIGEVLRTAFGSAEFRASLGTKFKDPVHYVLSAARLAYDGRTVPDTGPIIGWLFRTGEPYYGRPTPDGYPMARTEWLSPGQMATRFEVARAIAFRAPPLASELYVASMRQTLGPATQKALDSAASPREWNQMLLSSPEFMSR